jgi:hypothetical protein
MHGRTERREEYPPPHFIDVWLQILPNKFQDIPQENLSTNDCAEVVV